MDFLNDMSTTQKLFFGGVVIVIIVAIVILFSKNSQPTALPPRRQQQQIPPQMMLDLQQQQAQQQAQQQQPKGELVMFSMTGCGHCRNLEPTWDEFTRNFDGSNGIRIVKINNQENPEITQIHDIKGFPTIKYCPYGAQSPEGVVYQGDRSMESLIGFLQQF